MRKRLKYPNAIQERHFNSQCKSLKTNYLARFLGLTLRLHQSYLSLTPILLTLFGNNDAF